jgi:glycosyltransferase involved in cell wall biosynthesis/2-polyprenyl-3-methyl-5-hydroxy-6-metoxy-1,4-benzoquinol methylase
VAHRTDAFAEEATERLDGILIIGAVGSGVQELGSVLRAVPPAQAATHSGGSGRQALSELNDRLIEELGGTRQAPVTLPHSEVIRTLRPWAREAREAFVGAFGNPRAGSNGGPPWIWADPLNSVLAPFWLDVLGVRATAVLVHRPPEEVSPLMAHPEVDPLKLWDRYNRSALRIASTIPTVVVGFRELNEAPTESLGKIAKFLNEYGIDTDAWPGHESLSPGWIEPATTHRPAGRVPYHNANLGRLLEHYERAFPADTTSPLSVDDEMLNVLSDFYVDEYYRTGFGGIPYGRQEQHWKQFFGRIAERIDADLSPERVLDVGCAHGFLVEALRDRGIDAHGIDISKWAISEVPEQFKPYCRVGSITNELEGHYDLVTCIEVLEHLPRSVAQAAIANLCRHSDRVLFSSTSDDVDEPTHLNVETPDYWASLFADNGFYRDFDVDASYVAPQATLFSKGQAEIDEVVQGYERVLRRNRDALFGDYAQAVRAHDELSSSYAAMVAVVADQEERLRLASAEAKRELAELEARRLAEAVASTDALLHYDHRQYELARRLRETQDELAKAQWHIDGILQTRFYRYTTRIRKFYFLSRTDKKAPEIKQTTNRPPKTEPSYSQWVESYDTLTDAGRHHLIERLAALTDPPSMSIVVPVYNPPVQFLQEAIESVRSQIYQNWELCIVDDCSTDPAVAEALTQAEQSDPRIKVVRRPENGHISAASNSGLEMASGTWVAALDHDDTLAEHTLAMFALAIAANPGVGVLYSDEDKVNEQGVREDPFFKADFDPLLLLGQNYLCHLTMYKKELVDRAGGFRLGYEGSQDWDLAIRVTRDLSEDQILHIPHVLYHWRRHEGSTANLLSAKSYAGGAGERAVRDHLARSGRSGEVVHLPATGWNHVKWQIPDPAPLVSIVIPTRDGSYLGRCVESIRLKTVYPKYEIVVVDNGSLSRSTLEYLRLNEDSLTVIRDQRPFNYPDLNNNAVLSSNGDVICLLNDDTEILGPEWLDEMVGQLLQPSVGAVGAKLYYGNGLVQHAGVVLGIGGVAGHAYRMSDRLFPGDHGRMQLPRRYSAVTAACMAVRRQAWEDVSGMDGANLPVAFNDIDFCLRLGEAGWRTVWTPFAELTHYESVSRGADTEGERAIRFAGEIQYMKERWGALLRNDPTYNPNLTLIAEDFAPAWPPRVSINE